MNMIMVFIMSVWMVMQDAGVKMQVPVAFPKK